MDKDWLVFSFGVVGEIVSIVIWWAACTIRFLQGESDLHFDFGKVVKLNCLDSCDCSKVFILCNKVKENLTVEAGGCSNYKIQWNRWNLIQALLKCIIGIHERMDFLKLKRDITINMNMMHIKRSVSIN